MAAGGRGQPLIAHGVVFGVWCLTLGFEMEVRRETGKTRAVSAQNGDGPPQLDETQSPFIISHSCPAAIFIFVFIFPEPRKGSSLKRSAQRSGASAAAGRLAHRGSGRRGRRWG